MQVRTEIIEGRKRLIIIRESSGEDKSKEAVLRALGDGYKYIESKEEQNER